tara:strand:- start:45 stop:362 length:318 start_codon:yes stop_codon:yes gene_type:complete
MDVATLISDFGFPIVATLGLGYFIYYIWVWSTTVIRPVLNAAMADLIDLVDRIRMLDNDMIRLQQKLQMVLEFKEQYERMTGQKLDIDLDDIEKIKDSKNTTRDE